jgi:hypothetical protein
MVILFLRNFLTSANGYGRRDVAGNMHTVGKRSRMHEVIIPAINT